VTAENGEVLAFSFVFNGRDRWNARATIDAMGATLAAFARDSAAPRGRARARSTGRTAVPSTRRPPLRRAARLARRSARRARSRLRISTPRFASSSM
jgi:hypothetical protein